MDPLSQASLGAAAAALLARPGQTRRALLVGAFAGAAPDVDVLIKSAEDPLLQLQYHRHFTHSLLLAPVIGILVAVMIRWIGFRKEWTVRELIPFGIAGTLTHGLLDACTSYGTYLYWPFSGHRESWDLISIIDPLFTLPLVVLLVAAFVRRQPRLAWIGASWCLLYFTFGIVQRERAQAFARSLAESRGHQPTELSVRPSFANLVVWRLCYRNGDEYHVDAVRALPGTGMRHYPGSSVPVFDLAEAASAAPTGSTVARDIERFRAFSQGYLYRVPDRPEVIGDLRYSMFPNSVQPLWGITFDPAQTDKHIDMVYFRDPSARSFRPLWAMIQGRELAVSP